MSRCCNLRNRMRIWGTYVSDESFSWPEPEGEAARSESSLSMYVAACRSVADHLCAPVSPPLAPEGPSETSLSESLRQNAASDRGYTCLRSACMEPGA